MSHAFAVLSAMFPSGEAFFIRSVLNYRHQVDDAELRTQVNHFAGQEGVHGRMHRELNARLADLGYRTGLVERSVQIGFNRLAARLLPQSVQLAVTAALEHYTATLAEVVLSDGWSEAALADEQVRNIARWHALEECEHKTVAFDVYESVCGNTVMRAAAMDVMTGVFLGGLLFGTAYSALTGSSFSDIPSLARGLIRLPRSPFLSKSTRRRIRRYNRPDFHPDHFDSSAVIEHWRKELFA